MVQDSLNPNITFLGENLWPVARKMPIFMVKGVVIFQNNFGDSWDIHGMRPIILGYFYNHGKWHIILVYFSQLKQWK